MIIRISEGDKISISNNRLIVLNNIDSEGTPLDIEDKKGIALKDIRVIVIENLYSSITITTLIELNKNKINLIICNEKHQPQLQVLDLFSNYKVTERIEEQVQWSEDRKTKAFKKVIIGKITHQMDLLNFIEQVEPANQLLSLIEKMEGKEDITSQEIVSIEGVAARIYFQKLFKEEFRRFRDDFKNMGLDYGYTLIRTLVSKVLIAKGLHPTLGIQHSNVFNSYNLVDDLMEVLRPMIDYIVLFHLKEELNIEKLDKDHRDELLKVFFQKIEINGSLNLIDYAVEKYLDNFIAFMNQTKNEFELPKLVIEKYEY